MSGARSFTGAHRNTVDGATENNVGEEQTQHDSSTGSVHYDYRIFHGPISSCKEHDNGTVHGRSIENHGSYQENKSVARSDNLVTPEQLKDAFYDYFEHAIIEHAGSSTSPPWTDPSLGDLRRLWKKDMPNEFHGHFSSFSTTIEGLVAEALTKWRDSFGKAAVVTLESIFEEQDLDDVHKRKNYIAKQRAGSRLRNRPYYFTDTRNGTPTVRIAATLLSRNGAFQSHIVARTLSEHFKAIQRIPDNKRSSNPPSGALILTIFAIERTLDHYSSGNENVGPLGDLSKDTQVLTIMGPKLQAFTIGKNSKNQEWISYEVWSRINAAAQSHSKLPTIPVQEKTVQEETGDEGEVLMDRDPFQ
ncbi:hypothetical protein K435DRAFT_810042 [Dendrothele bispora CBS 962.96]|uniref:Uncharacterized protein n=1 Tax=Dendrothele bispora (strain CBS 962.96) TaxID=1314807 RepID=A0A4S8KXD1_DENBC|nr:hypothetical protein K435DRAFT_810042 [Dendrothele bispora CBS 962.96]